VVASVEGAMDATQCGGASDCHAGTRCLAHGLLSELNSQVDNFLISKSLEDVISNERSSQDRKLKDLIVTG